MSPESVTVPFTPSRPKHYILMNRSVAISAHDDKESAVAAAAAFLMRETDGSGCTAMRDMVFNAVHIVPSDERVPLKASIDDAVDGVVNAYCNKPEPHRCGDVVQLRSGGPRMSIVQIVGADAHCAWFPDLKIDRAVFPLSALEYATP